MTKDRDNHLTVSDVRFYYFGSFTCRYAYVACR